MIFINRVFRLSGSLLFPVATDIGTVLYLCHKSRLYYYKTVICLCIVPLLVWYQTVDCLVTLSLRGDSLSHRRNSAGSCKRFTADITTDKVTWNVVRAYYMQLTCIPHPQGCT